MAAQQIWGSVSGKLSPSHLVDGKGPWKKESGGSQAQVPIQHICSLSLLSSSLGWGKDSRPIGLQGQLGGSGELVVVLTLAVHHHHLRSSKMTQIQGPTSDPPHQGFGGQEPSLFVAQMSPGESKALPDCESQR